MVMEIMVGAMFKVQYHTIIATNLGLFSTHTVKIMGLPNGCGMGHWQSESVELLFQNGRFNSIHSNMNGVQFGTGLAWGARPVNFYTLLVHSDSANIFPTTRTHEQRSKSILGFGYFPLSVLGVFIPHICHFWYTTIFFRPVKGTPKKCVKSRQKLPRDKTA